MRFASALTRPGDRAANAVGGQHEPRERVAARFDGTVTLSPRSDSGEGYAVQQHLAAAVRERHGGEDDAPRSRATSVVAAIRRDYHRQLRMRVGTATLTFAPQGTSTNAT